MKIHVEHDGTVFDYESEPMPKERFDALIAVAVTLIVSAAILGLFALLTRWRRFRGRPGLLRGVLFAVPAPDKGGVRRGLT